MKRTNTSYRRTRSLIAGAVAAGLAFSFWMPASQAATLDGFSYDVDLGTIHTGARNRDYGPQYADTGLGNSHYSVGYFHHYEFRPAWNGLTRLTQPLSTATYGQEIWQSREQVNYTNGNLDLGQMTGQFTNTYNFSLDGKTNLDMALVFVNRENAQWENMFGSDDNGNMFRYELRDASGRLVYSGFLNTNAMYQGAVPNQRDINGQSQNGGWLINFSGLEQGNYRLSLSGEVGLVHPDVEKYFQGQSYLVELAAGNAGDPSQVPLPGALVLLGTALAGGGVMMRRKSKKVKSGEAKES